MAQFMRFLELPWKRILRRAYQIVLDEGFLALARKAKVALRNLVFSESYGRWIARYDTLDRTARQTIEADIARLPSRPIISLFMPISGDDEVWLGGTIRTVQKQIYPHWELCLVVGHSPPEPLSRLLHALAGQDGRIRVAQVEDPATWAGKVNAALKLASGDFVALLGPGDALSEHAL